MRVFVRIDEKFGICIRYRYQSNERTLRPGLLALVRDLVRRRGRAGVGAQALGRGGHGIGRI